MIWIKCDVILQERLCEESTIIERKKKLKENFTPFHFLYDSDRCYFHSKVYFGCF